MGLPNQPPFTHSALPVLHAYQQLLLLHGEES